MDLWQIIPDLTSNFIILGTILAAIIAQVVKFIIASIQEKKLDFSYLFSPSGMPSGHTTSVICLSTLTGHFEGFGSTFFAIAICFSLIIMYDAVGVRYQAGKHAEMLNQLLDKYTIYDSEEEDSKHYFSVRIGHTLPQVLGGVMTGLLVALGIIFWLG